MEIYIIILVCIIYLIFLKNVMKITNKVLCIFCAFLIFIIIGFRDSSVGTDTATYIELYKLSPMYINSFLNGGISLSSEVLFHFSAYILNILGFDVRVYLIITALFIVFSFTRFILKYSSIPLLSLWLFITLGFLGLSLSALRQILAMSVALFAIDFLFKRNFIKFFITIFIASLFHFSAWVLLPIYFLIKKVQNVNYYGRNLILISSIFLGFGVKQFFYLIISLMTVGLNYNYYINEFNPIGTSYKMIVINIAIVLFFSFVYQLSSKDILSIQYFNMFYVMACINILILVISLDQAIISRLGYYFYISVLIIIPNSISKIKNSEFKFLILFITIVLTLFYFIITTNNSYSNFNDYKFYKGF